MTTVQGLLGVIHIASLAMTVSTGGKIMSWDVCGWAFRTALIADTEVSIEVLNSGDIDTLEVL